MNFAASGKRGNFLAIEESCLKDTLGLNRLARLIRLNSDSSRTMRRKVTKKDMIAISTIGMELTAMYLSEHLQTKTLIMTAKF